MFLPFLEVVYLVQIHVVPSPVAPLFGFSAALAATLKSVLWVLEESYCGWCTIGHNAPLQIFMSWTLPIVYVLLRLVFVSLLVWLMRRHFILFY